MKRIITTTILGIIFGVICTQISHQGDEALAIGSFISILLSRALLGFAIGISKLKMDWWFHGIVLGGIFSLPLAFNVFSNECQNQILLFFGFIFLGIIYGFLIELITSVLLRMKNKEDIIAQS
ncbi:MAG TPA: hypothetical protein PKY56_00425 [Candidatus Kapabacteria bacterium]|nr:hypothetical protein [Candidatus Kapabacteria bacterium]HPO61752.1 hypothetical protein [Candidatus Kapabacteria bacterium]